MTTSPLPQAEVLDLSLDDLALRILRYLSSSPALAYRSHVTNVWTWRPADHGLTWDPVERKVADAWDLLLRLGLLELDRTPANAQMGETATLTDLGREVATRDDDLRAARAEARLALGLHPLLEADVRAQFRQRNYEPAILFAMREVEIRVRDLAGYGPNEYGVPLMRKAFHVDNGPLTDSAQAGGERHATSELFAGAMGVFKNPSSHRQVDFDDPPVAAEIILLADLLLRTLDAVEART